MKKENAFSLEFSVLDRSLDSEKKNELLRLFHHQLLEGIEVYSNWKSGRLSLDGMKAFSHKIKSKFLMFSDSKTYEFFDELEHMEKEERAQELGSQAILLLKKSIAFVDAEIHNN